MRQGVRPRSGRQWLAAATLVVALCAFTPRPTGAQAPSASQAQSVVVPVENGDFEKGEAGAPPPGWGGNLRAAAEGAPGPAYRALIDKAAPHRGRASVRVERIAAPAPGAPPFASLSQRIDATPFRGRQIRLTAAVRAGTPPAESIGLWLRVDRSNRGRGFFDNMGDRPISSPQWADYSIEGEVASDAEHIAFGLILTGAGQAWMDNVRLEIVGPASAAATPNVTPAENLDRAIALLREHHINSRSADWARITAEARQLLAGARDSRDSYDAIQHVIDALGERHTTLRLAPAWKRPGAAPRQSLPMPTHELVGDRFGMVRLPGFMGSPEEAARYRAVLREAVVALDRRGVCGWIVDLRDNTGGSMWPMLNGLDPLLGAGPFGSFRFPAGRLTHWIRAKGDIRPAEAAASSNTAIQLRSPNAPIALLLGRRTASSGELTAIAFLGRGNLRSFGTPTAGLSTANRAFPLPDGARLVVTTSYARDRTGREYKGTIQPDEPTALADAPAAAQRWLASQPCPR